MPDNQRRSSGLLIPIILIVGLACAISFGWWWRARTSLPFEPMPVGTPTKVAQLVEQGDRLYRDALEHLKNSNAKVNPDWAVENRKALDLFKKSRDSYDPAAAEYAGGISIPSPLRDRIRDATMQSYMCRRRLVGAEPR